MTAIHRKHFRDWMHNGDFRPIHGWLALLVFAIPVAIYTFKVAPDFVSRDVWRFIDIIRHYYSGNLSVDDFWDTHSSHRTPGYKLFFLLNAVWFSLDLRMEAFLGFLVHVVVGGAIMHQFVSRIPKVSRPFLLLGIVALAAAWMSLNQAHFYTYSLLSLSAGLSAAFFVTTLVYVDRYIRDSHPGDLIIFCTIWTVGLFGFGAGKTPAMAASLFFALAVHAAVNSGWRRPAGIAAIAIAILTLAEQLVYWIGLDRADVSGLNHFSFPEAGQFFLAGIGAAAVDTNLFRHSPISAVNVAIAAGTLLTILAGLLFFEFASKSNNKQVSAPNVLFLTLLVYGFVFVVTVLVARLNWGVAAATAPRYIHESRFLVIGLIGLAAVTRRPRRAASMAVTLLFIALIILDLANMGSAFQTVPYRIRAQQTVEEQFHAAVFEDGELKKNWGCPVPALCKEELEFLREHELNIFSAKYRDEKEPAELE